MYLGARGSQLPIRQVAIQPNRISSVHQQTPQTASPSLQAGRFIVPIAHSHSPTHTDTKSRNYSIHFLSKYFCSFRTNTETTRSLPIRARAGNRKYCPRRTPIPSGSAPALPFAVQGEWEVKSDRRLEVSPNVPIILKKHLN